MNSLSACIEREWHATLAMNSLSACVANIQQIMEYFVIINFIILSCDIYNSLKGRFAVWFV